MCIIARPRPVHCFVQAVEIGEMISVTLYARDVPANRLYRSVQLLLAAAGYENVGAISEVAPVMTATLPANFAILLPLLSTLIDLMTSLV